MTFIFSCALTAGFCYLVPEMILHLTIGVGVFLGAGVTLQIYKAIKQKRKT